MNSWMSDEDKLDFIYTIEDSQNMSVDNEMRLYSLLSDENPEIRYAVCEVLSFFLSDQNEDILRRMLRDRDRLVRACACDSLALGRSEESLIALIKACSDRTSLVRGYAVLSLADVQRNLNTPPDRTIEFLYAMEKSENSTWVLIALYRSLFLLGIDDYGVKLLDCINDRYYKNRCFVLSLIEEIIGLKMEHLIPNLSRVLLQRLSSESAGAVRGKLENVVNALKLKGTSI